MGRSGGYQARIGNKRQTTLDAWLAVIQFDAGQQLDLSILDAAAEVVETLHTRRRGLRGSLRRMGTRWAISAGRSSS